MRNALGVVLMVVAETSDALSQSLAKLAEASVNGAEKVYPSEWMIEDVLRKIPETHALYASVNDQTGLRYIQDRYGNG